MDIQIDKCGCGNDKNVLWQRCCFCDHRRNTFAAAALTGLASNLTLNGLEVRSLVDHAFVLADHAIIQSINKK